MNVDTGVYSITNTVNGKRYIGSSRSISQRWRDHKKLLRDGTHHCKPLQRSWDKHGEISFLFEKIALCPITDLLIVEQERINRLNPEYNVLRTAGSPLGIKLTPEHRAKIGAAHKGRIITDEMRARISKKLLGGKLSAAHREKISQSNKGRIFSPETRARLATALKGRKRPDLALANTGSKRTEETRRNISLSKQNISEETRARMSAAAKARCASPEARARMSEARKGIQISQEARAKQAAAQRGLKRTDATKAKQSEAAKKRWLPGGDRYEKRAEMSAQLELKL